MATAVHAETVSPALVWDTLLGFQRTAALRAAIELNLFGAIGEGADDVASLARRCSASERGIRILSDYLTIIGLLNKKNGRYSHTPTSAAFLDPHSPACIASIARFTGNATMSEPCLQLAEIVRSGTTVLPGDGSVEPDNPVWVEFAHSMVPMIAPVTAPFATIALDGLSGPVRVLDIAAGHGLFGIAVAKQNPQAHIVALDWAAVLDVAKANARKAGIEDRYKTLPGSAFDVDYQGPYDVALLTNFLHHFDPPTCVTILRKVRSSLKPGGRVAILEFVPSEDRVSPPMPAAFSLIMLTTTASGDAYTLKELEGMCREAAFERVTEHRLPASPQTAVVGYAPLDLRLDSDGSSDKSLE
jgi:2-polyprenyl-3-methyl-5-hydroxy-6-metoxy-1,4-benzoquinol methylase